MTEKGFKIIPKTEPLPQQPMNSRTKKTLLTRQRIRRRKNAQAYTSFTPKLTIHPEASLFIALQYKCSWLISSTRPTTFDNIPSHPLPPPPTKNTIKTRQTIDPPNDAHETSTAVRLPRCSSNGRQSNKR